MNPQPAAGLDRSLVKITKGASIAFLGSLVGLAFAFLGRLLAARIGTEAEYGIFSLAFVVLSIGAVAATLGLDQGATRSIAYARGKGNYDQVPAFVNASMQFGLMVSILLAIAVFFASDAIATSIFDDSALGFPLRVFALGIPFLTLINIVVGIFRGFDDVKPKALFQDISRNLLFTLFLIPFIFFDLSYDGVFYAMLASLGMTGILAVGYMIKNLPSPIRIANRFWQSHLSRELIVFSIPLSAVAMLQLLIMWVDTLMIGWFETSADVGLYSAAHPMAQFISTPLVAIGQIYIPIAAGLYAQGSLSQLRRNYSIITKWLSIGTLPVFLVMFLFPETILTFAWGKGYAPADDALRILSLGFMIHNLAGPNSGTLIVQGETRFIMWATLATAVLNIILNIIMIPLLGIEGAAIASVAAMTSINLVLWGRLYSTSRINPISRNLTKSIVAALTLIAAFQYTINCFVSVVWWMLPLFFTFYYILCGLAVLLTKSFDQEDVALFLALEKRSGIDLSKTKRFLRRFA